MTAMLLCAQISHKHQTHSHGIAPKRRRVDRCFDGVLKYCVMHVEYPQAEEQMSVSESK